MWDLGRKYPAMTARSAVPHGDSTEPSPDPPREAASGGGASAPAADPAAGGRTRGRADSGDRAPSDSVRGLAAC